MSEMDKLTEHAKRVIAESKPPVPSGQRFTLRYGRVVNLGNYESVRIELEQSFDETTPKDQALEMLSRRVEGYALNRKKHPELFNPYNGQKWKLGKTWFFVVVVADGNGAYLIPSVRWKRMNIESHSILPAAT